MIVTNRNWQALKERHGLSDNCGFALMEVGSPQELDRVCERTVFVHSGLKIDSGPVGFHSDDPMLFSFYEQVFRDFRTTIKKGSQQ